MTVGVRELKNKLSHYLQMVRRGERIAVTDRGTVIAYVLPAANAPEYEGLVRLIKEERASWGGGKPAGSKKPSAVKGKPVSEVILEERR